MLTFLINLDRRPDRLAGMTEVLGRLGVRFERFAAEDGATYPPAGPAPSLTNGEVACHRSHRACWNRLLQSDESHALVFEDDLVVSPRLPLLLGRLDWVPDDAHLIRLESSYRPGFVSLRPRPAPGGFSLCRMLSPQNGSAAYIVSRAGATALLVDDRSQRTPVDHFFFECRNPNGSALNIYQVNPAPCIQGWAYYANSHLPPAMGSDLATERSPHFDRYMASVRPHRGRLLPGGIKRALRPAYHRYVLRVRTDAIGFDGPIPGGDGPAED